MRSPQHILVAIGVLVCALVAEGFQNAIRPAAIGTSTTTSSLLMAAKGGKGFGEPSAPIKKSSPPPPPPAAVEDKPAASSSAAPIPATDYDKAADQATPLSTKAEDGPQLNAGQRALAQMRAERQGKKDEELRRIAEIRDMDLQVKEEAAAIPERVAQRMGKRMLPFVGIPLFGGMGAFVGFWYFATYKDVEFEPIVVAGSTIALLAISLLGITYSVLSASWDDDRDGSGLGIDEFQKNVGSISEGVKRSRENQLLRERMAGLPEEEIEAAIRELDMREAREEKRKETLKEKMEKELR
eukprot:CAMPEP_0178494604 /NCGR_PEP_ID=MMETSP0696-20121128/13101_1 /TAXON_ID=265572 /ORGANISM="Extubocellulus spinifer, Strain CCMP396" /LENGTH=297 /DNA_ID=CAMNT_0020122689 /DNA_START=56 /DNA_END=949 /DNA_ORIENTATION=+